MDSYNNAQASCHPCCPELRRRWWDVIRKASAGGQQWWASPSGKHFHWTATTPATIPQGPMDLIAIAVIRTAKDRTCASLPRRVELLVGGRPLCLVPALEQLIRDPWLDLVALSDWLRIGECCELADLADLAGCQYSIEHVQATHSRCIWACRQPCFSRGLAKMYSVHVRS